MRVAAERMVPVVQLEEQHVPGQTVELQVPAEDVEEVDEVDERQSAEQVPAC